jgi:predicted dehydrogenase
MPNHLARKVLLVGAGPMAEAYASVLSAQQQPFIVVGRGMEAAQRFRAKTGLQPVTGGIESFSQRADLREYSEAIVAVGMECLAGVTTMLLAAGMKRILVEKPGGLNRMQIEALADKAADCQAEVYVAYNRRFYASTQTLKRYVEADGGVRSFFFEFTEWSHQIAGLKKAKGVKENWLLGNSSHVIDLAFYLCGAPKEIHAFSGGELAWHPKAIFAGAGLSRTGALFAYHANWDAPGRWGLEVLTREHRLILRPLETLQAQKRASTAIENVAIDDDLDKRFKPGVFQEVQAFMGENDLSGCFCSLEQHLGNVTVYETILHGGQSRGFGSRAVAAGETQSGSPRRTSEFE